MATKKVSADKVLKEKSKVVGSYLNATDGVDVFTLTQILKKKTQLEELKKAVKEFEAEYNGLRDEIVGQIEQIETSKYDTVDVVLDNMRAKKYPRNSKAGKVDEEKTMEFARKKKIIGRLYEKKLVLNEEKLVELLEDGTITQNEFIKISIQAISPVLEVSYVDEKEGENTPSVDEVKLA
jgi:hypothetical protein